VKYVPYFSLISGFHRKYLDIVFSEEIGICLFKFLHLSQNSITSENIVLQFSEFCALLLLFALFIQSIDKISDIWLDLYCRFTVCSEGVCWWTYMLLQQRLRIVINWLSGGVLCHQMNAISLRPEGKFFTYLTHIYPFWISSLYKHIWSFICQVCLC